MAARSPTGGGLVFTGFTDGTFAAYDDATLKELWKINVGTGFNAPPMTFAVERQTVRRDPLGPQPLCGVAARRYAGMERAAQPDDAVRVRAVI